MEEQAYIPSNTSVEVDGVDNGVIRQRPAPIELKLISWPPNKNLPVSTSLLFLHGYKYEGRLNLEDPLFIIDSGINIAHKVRLRGGF